MHIGSTDPVVTNQNVLLLMAFIIIFVVSTEGQDYIRWLKGLRPYFADSMILNDKKRKR